MIGQLRDGLKRIADRVDRKHLQEAERLQKAVWEYQPVERIPVVMHSLTPPEWIKFPYNETFDNPEKMLWNQLFESYVGVSVRDDRMMTVRPNFWVANLPSLFGRPFVVDENTTWIKACHDSQVIHRLVDRGVPDLTEGLCARSIELFEIYRGYLAEAGLSDVIHLFQTDNQGPFDCAYRIWGEEIHTAIYDAPDLVHQFLNLLTETTIAYVGKIKQAMQEPPDYIYHWWYRVPGGVRVVDDSSTMLSPATYHQFCRPYNERIYAAFGGGYMHYCGHGLQSQSLRVATPGLRGIEMGAGEVGLQNPNYVLDKICQQAAKHRVTICWIGPPGLPAARPKITTGLIYGNLDPGLPWEQAPERLKQVKEFWKND
jgi:hypothetical protein